MMTRWMMASRARDRLMNWPRSYARGVISATAFRRTFVSSPDWLGELRAGGSRYSVSVRPEDYSLIVYPGEGGVDHDALLASDHKAFVIASLMNPDR